MSILVVGSVALDDVTSPAGRAENAIGGSAIHFAAAASFFAPVRVVGVVGTDFPHDKIEFLKSRNVDLSGIEVVEGKTFHWKGEYTQDWNSAITHDTQLNVFETFQPKIPQAFRESDYLFLANIDPTLQLSVLDQLERPQLTALDTMNFWIDGKFDELLEVVKRVNLLFLNDGEARLLTKRVNLLDAADDILKLGPTSLVIKKGEHGGLLFYDKRIFALPAFPVTTIKDPTGAGDSFAGAFMGYLAHAGRIDHETLRRAVVYGSVLASFIVTDFSCDRLRTLTTDEIEKRYNEFKELVHF